MDNAEQFDPGISGGDNWSRTSGLRSASAALSQLSYTPEKLLQNFGGDRGVRTPDLLLAKQALSQLSYAPTMSDNSA
jgi:hypothetical protein